VSAYFAFAQHGTNFQREVLAGVTTFLTMAYIVVVNPAVLAAAGIPRGASVFRHHEAGSCFSGRQFSLAEAAGRALS
jgi:xanthine/uracil/vitamin C permease (AzgA family)